MNRAPSREWSCRDYGRLLGAYLDGQLDAAMLVDTEAHVARCESCREELALLRAMRGSMKRELRSVSAPSGMRARMEQAMLAENARTESRKAAESQAQKSPWRSFGPLASAAAIGLVLYSSMQGQPLFRQAHSMANADSLLAEIIAEHARPLPPERTDPKEVRAFEQYVGVPVHPARFEKGGARLVGGRVLPIHQERAAMLQYEIGQGADLRRVSVVIYDPRKIQVNENELTPRAIGSAQVRVGQARGYSVAVAESGGVGYALASDLDTERSAQLAAMVLDDNSVP
jgi:anti-sigma factor RsiW